MSQLRRPQVLETYLPQDTPVIALAIFITAGSTVVLDCFFVYLQSAYLCSLGIELKTFTVSLSAPI